jgi:hypothetical protein
MVYLSSYLLNGTEFLTKMIAENQKFACFAILNKIHKQIYGLQCNTSQMLVRRKYLLLAERLLADLRRVEKFNKDTTQRIYAKIETHP